MLIDGLTNCCRVS